MSALLPSASNCCSPCDNSTLTTITLSELVARELTQLYGYFSVTEYGAVGDGVTDDTAAIQSAVDAACVAGGVVLFPSPFTYLITSRILVQSLYPVHLVGDMYGDAHTELTPFTSSILIGGPDAGFRYSSPTATRSDAGGGVIRGLTFSDPTFISPLEQGTHSTLAVLDLVDFNSSLVTQCRFDGILGSAIRTESCANSSIQDSVFHTCGHTSRPALYLTQFDSNATTRSFVVSNCQFSFNRATYYLRVDNGSNLSGISIRDCHFEADFGNAATHQVFLSVANSFTTVTGCSFSANQARALVFESTALLSTASMCKFIGMSSLEPSVEIVGNICAIESSMFATGKTGDEILVSGLRNSVLNSRFFGSGGIRYTGAQGIVSGLTIALSLTTNDFVVDVTSDTVVGLIVIDGVGVTAGGGIRVDGTLPKVVGASVIGMMGVGISADSANSMVVASSAYNNTGGDFVGTNLPNVVEANFFTGGQYLQGSASYDPASIAAGATLQTTVTVTNARRGDFSEASITTGVAGVVVLSQVTADDTVTVTFWNTTAGAINILSGIVYAKVRPPLT